jgi:GDP-mannose 6-dehydrogenase
MGYVGCVSAACFSALGYRVIGVDRDPHKVESVLRGEAPFYEPGLREQIQKGREGNRLSATTSVGEALESCDIALICVGTPSEKNGNLGLEQLRRVVEEIASHRRAAGLLDRKLTVVIRSTVFPGTCEEEVAPAFVEDPAVTVVSHPEFLREGTAVEDFLVPSLTVVGGNSAESTAAVAALYAPLNAEVQQVSLRTAEMIKYACNAFHALKIAFANEIGSLGKQLGVDGQEVMETLCKDMRLNISSAYLRPGFAFGGSCLPKDLRALVYRGSRMDLHLPLLEAVLPSNDSHLRRAISRVMEHPSSRIGIYGLAFKEDTDDLRESPVVSLIEHLIGKGRDLRIYDRNIQVDQIYGANRQFLLKAVPHIERFMAPMSEMMEWADVIVIAQKPSAQDRQRIDGSGRPVLDLTVC